MPETNKVTAARTTYRGKTWRAGLAKSFGKMLAARIVFLERHGAQSWRMQRWYGSAEQLPRREVHETQI